jgi:hypothetical protein
VLFRHFSRRIQAKKGGKTDYDVSIFSLIIISLAVVVVVFQLGKGLVHLDVLYTKSIVIGLLFARRKRKKFLKKETREHFLLKTFDPFYRWKKKVSDFESNPAAKKKKNISDPHNLVEEFRTDTQQNRKKKRI